MVRKHKFRKVTDSNRLFACDLKLKFTEYSVNLADETRVGLVMAAMVDSLSLLLRIA